MGTSVGTQVFLKYGWRPAAALSVGWCGFCLLMLFIRGPHAKRYTWFGYEGGVELRKSKLPPPPTPGAPAPATPVDEKASIGTGSSEKGAGALKAEVDPAERV